MLARPRRRDRAGRPARRDRGRASSAGGPGPGASPPLFVAALLLGTLAFAGLGLLMAGALRAEATLALANGLFIAFLLLGGIVIPVAHLPEPLAALAGLLPAAALADAFRVGARLRRRGPDVGHGARRSSSSGASRRRPGRCGPSAGSRPGRLAWPLDPPRPRAGRAAAGPAIRRRNSDATDRRDRRDPGAPRGRPIAVRRAGRRATPRSAARRN